MTDGGDLATSHDELPGQHRVRGDGGLIDRRTMIARAAALGLTTTGIPGLLAACGSSAGTVARVSEAIPAASGLSAQGSPQRGGTLTIAWDYPPIAQMDPQLPTQQTTGDLNSLLLVHDQLAHNKPHTFDVDYGLAEHWEPSPDGQEWTIRLREAYFSDGAAVTAADAQFSLERFSNPTVNSQYVFLSAIDRVRTLDSRTIRVTLRYPQGDFLDSLAHASASIVPQRLVQAQGKAYGQRPVGAGPFMFGSKVAGQSIEFARNEHYWKSVYLDGVTIHNLPDDTSRVLGVTSGQYLVGLDIPYSQVPRLRSAAGTRLQIEPITLIVYVQPNVRSKPLDDVNVRLALNYAIPRDQMIGAVFNNAAIVANSPLGLGRYWSEAVPPYPYNLTKAKAYLAKSSAPHGFTTNLGIVGTDSASVQIATILQSSWAQIGVKVRITETDFPTLLNAMSKASYGLVLQPVDSWSSDMGADDEQAEWFDAPAVLGASAALTWLFYSDPTAYALTIKATHTINDAVRRRTFAELQRHSMYVDPPMIPIAFGEARTLVKSSVQGLVTLANKSWRLEDVWLSG